MTPWSINYGLVTDAAGAAGDARAARHTVQDVEARVERLQLVCEAMWTLVKEKLGVTEIDLLNRVNELDMSDGKLDGKVRRMGHKCPSCGKVIGPRFANCMYCGQAVQHQPFA